MVRHLLAATPCHVSGGGHKRQSTASMDFCWTRTVPAKVVTSSNTRTVLPVIALLDYADGEVALASRSEGIKQGDGHQTASG